MDGKDPLGYPLGHYLWVILIACVGGAIRHINSMQRFAAGKALIDVVTAGFTGVITFWICEAWGIKGPMSAVMIAVGGLMGNRGWRELESLWRAKIGMAGAIQLQALKDKQEDEAAK